MNGIHAKSMLPAEPRPRHTIKLTDCMYIYIYQHRNVEVRDVNLRMGDSQPGGVHNWHKMRPCSL